MTTYTEHNKPLHNIRWPMLVALLMVAVWATSGVGAYFAEHSWEEGMEAGIKATPSLHQKYMPEIVVPGKELADGSREINIVRDEGKAIDKGWTAWKRFHSMATLAPLAFFSLLFAAQYMPAGQMQTLAAWGFALSPTYSLSWLWVANQTKIIGYSLAKQDMTTHLLAGVGVTGLWLGWGLFGLSLVWAQFFNKEVQQG